MNAEFKINLAPVTDENVTGVAREIINDTRAKMGMVPNMYRTMANSTGFFSTYAHGYSAFRQGSCDIGDSANRHNYP